MRLYSLSLLQLGLDGDRSLFDKHIEPLVYAVAIVLPLAYLTGVVFTLKTHTSYVYDEFYQQLSDEDNSPSRETLMILKTLPSVE